MDHFLPYFALITALVELGIGAGYCIKIIRKEADPPVATWIIFMVGVAMSLIPYLLAPVHDWLRDIVNVVDCASVTAILTALLIRHWGSKVPFTRLQRFCLVLAAITAIAWMVLRIPVVGVGGSQLVMIIAYFPTFEKLLKHEGVKCPEPVSMWAPTAMAGFMGVCVALLGKGDFLAALYPGRAMLLCCTVLLLIWRFRRKQAHIIATTGA